MKFVFLDLISSHKQKKYLLTFVLFIFGRGVDAAVPMVEAMVALVLVDQLMAQYAQCYLFSPNSDLQAPFKLPSLERAKML